mgnify:FL=1
MNENLQRRIQNLMGNDPMPMGMQMGGEVEQPMPEMMPQQADNSMLESAINELMMASDEATDPLESAKAEQMAEGMRLAVEAPMSAMAQELSAMGRGDDTQLAHLQPGEVVLPPEMFDDPQFETAVESRFNELDLDPERYVVGMGIASLNPSTGLEEFGFFKKVGKFFKKIVKPVAKVAQFVPGPWQAPAALLSKASTVVDVARGKANPLALATVFGPGATGGSFSENLKNITSQGGISGTFSGIGDALSKGIGNLVENPLKTLFGRTTDPGGGITTLRDLFASATFSGQPKIGLSALSQAQIDNLTPEQLAALQQQEQMMALQKSGFSLQDYDDLAKEISDAGGDPSIDNILQLAKQQFPEVANVLDFTQRQNQSAQDSGSGFLQNLMGGNLGLGGLGGLGIAGLLGKLAYDEAKNKKGVPLTPMTQMDSMGRFNIEAEIARRMGQDAPNPVEFGLLPANTMPQLSGGRPSEPVTEEEPVGMEDGGSVSSVPEGMKEFFLTTHINDMTVGQQDMLRDLINDDPVFAEAYYDSDDLRMPMSDFEVVTNVPEGMFGGQASNEELMELMSISPSQVKERFTGVGGLMKPRRRDKGKRNASRLIKLQEIARRRGKIMPSSGAMGGVMSDREMDQFLNSSLGQMYMGGPVMAYAKGGNVSEEEFKKKSGKINGPGTETSDDIPAMLSDGEFVFKSQSVRGAGAFDMNKKRGGIIELVPNKEESRERGTDLMYEMMDLFSSYATKRA